MVRAINRRFQARTRPLRGNTNRYGRGGTSCSAGRRVSGRQRPRCLGRLLFGPYTRMLQTGCKYPRISRLGRRGDRRGGLISGSSDNCAVIEIATRRGNIRHSRRRGRWYLGGGEDDRFYRASLCTFLLGSIYRFALSISNYGNVWGR